MMQKQQQQATSPAQMYEQYFGPAIFTPWARVLLDLANPKPGEHALDLACGTGLVARQLAPLLGEEGRIVAIDISPAMLGVARELPPPPGAPIEWREGNAVDFARPHERFDLVLCQQGLQFFPDKSKALKQIRQVLAEGGRAFVAVWQGLEQHPVYKALFEAESKHLGIPLAAAAAPFYLGSADELHRLFSEAGFQKINISPKTQHVEFPHPEKFIQYTMLATAAVMPEFDPQDEEARNLLFNAVMQETQDTIRQYQKGDKLIFPMTTNIVEAS